MDVTKKISLFSGVSEAHRILLNQKMIRRVYEADELILDFEDQSKDVLFILSGKVRVLYRSVLGREVILADIGAQNFFGELSAIDEQGRSANVTALHKTEIAHLPRALFIEIVTGTPDVARQVLEVLVARIRALDLRFSEMSVLKTNERLYAELLRLSQKRKGSQGQRIISPPPFHHHLAARIGCRREVVSRELSALARDGIIEKTRGGLVIVDCGELETRLSHALN